MATIFNIDVCTATTVVLVSGIIFQKNSFVLLGKKISQMKKYKILSIIIFLNFLELVKLVVLKIEYSCTFTEAK